MKYKAKDIAKELGVSPSAVSLVLNNKPGVGERKRKEILLKIEELGCGYLVKEQEVTRGDIGFVIYKCGRKIIDEYPFFNYLSESITRAMEKNNHTMTIMYIDRNMPLQEQLQLLENDRYCGYIVYAVEMFPEDLEVFKRISVPCVYLDNPFPSSAVNTVTADNYLGIYQGFDYLYQKGHREIGYIKSKVPVLCFQERIQSYYKCVDDLGLKVNPEHIMEVGYLEAETEKDIEEYLDQSGSLPTAFLADNDLLACRVVRAFKKRGINVPDEVSVIGFDNRPICYFTEPKVTTVQLPGDEMGEMAVEMLLRNMKDSKMATAKYKLGTSLIENESVRTLD